MQLNTPSFPASPAQQIPLPAVLPARLFSLGENMIEILVEGEGEIPEELFERYLLEPDRRVGPKDCWQSGTLSAQVSESLRAAADQGAVSGGEEVTFDDSGFQVFLRVAGDAYDVAATAAALGTPAHFMGAVGDCPASEFMWQWMSREGVDLTHCARIPNTQVASHFLVRGSKRYSRWESAAWHVAPGLLEVDYTLRDVFLTFGGTTQMLSPSMREAVLEQVRAAREAGATVAYNLNDRPDLRESTGELLSAFDEVAGSLDLLFVGLEETAVVFGLPLEPSESEDDSAVNAREAARALLPRCPNVRCLFLTDGKYGAYLFERNQKPRHVAAHIVDQRDVVEPIGAGDAFVGGTLHGVLHGLPHHRAAQMGAVAAQLNTLGHGAVVPPDRDQVLQHLKQHFHWPPELLRRV